MEKTNWKVKWEHISLGLFIFSIGLAKKTLLGDPLTNYAQPAFDHVQDLTMIEAWYSSISYVLAYYFDLSGYADMAIGIGKMFNINLPMNFNSPYKSRNFAEYWQKWHITLSRFLGDYVYRSLPGDKRNFRVVYASIMATFLVSGFWHGAGWTFVVWGLLNGVFVVLSHVMRKADKQLNLYLAWSLTFFGVIITRILFVSNDFQDAWHVMYLLFDISAIEFVNLKYASAFEQSIYIIIGLILVLFFKNSMEMANKFKPNFKHIVYTSILLSASIQTFYQTQEFLYFQF